MPSERNRPVGGRYHERKIPLRLPWYAQLLRAIITLAAGPNPAQNAGALFCCRALSANPIQALSSLLGFVNQSLWFDWCFDRGEPLGRSVPSVLMVRLYCFNRRYNRQAGKTHARRSDDLDRDRPLHHLHSYRCGELRERARTLRERARTQSIFLNGGQQKVKVLADL